MSADLHDIELPLEDRPGALADFGAALGAAGVSLEGGGVFTLGATAIAHFLVADGSAAREALAGAGLGPVRVSPVIVLTLDQETPGQLGLVARRFADAGIGIRVQYSDHANRLVLVVAEHDQARAEEIARDWDEEREERGSASRAVTRSD